MTKRILAIIFSGTLALAALAASPASATAPANDGPIVFVHGIWDADRGIAMADADGTNLHELFTFLDGAWADGLAWSPDSSKFLFSGCCYGDIHDSVDLWTLDADGTNLTRVTTAPGREDQGAWSPDGSRIAYSTRLERNRGLVSIASDGSDPQQLTTWPGVESEPTWSPDGSKIVFVRRPLDGKPYLGVINADGSGVAQLGTVFHASSPDWSPDGTKILFIHDRNIWVMDADGTNAVSVTDFPTSWDHQGDRTSMTSIEDAAWSPSGAKIVFARWRVSLDTKTGQNMHRDAEIWTMNADGTGATALRSTGRDDVDRFPAWQPTL